MREVTEEMWSAICLELQFCSKEIVILREAKDPLFASTAQIYRFAEGHD